MATFRGFVLSSACVGMLFATAARADVFSMPSGQTSITMVPVGNPGNAPDPATGNLYGSVGYNYNIDAYDVTLGQYTQFLNAVATKSDADGCYNSCMVNGNSQYPFGISQTWNAVTQSYSYSVAGSNPQARNMPVTWVSWLDAARFCNWLQNGQPTTGVENNTTTETGAYTLDGDVSSGTETRNPGAQYLIPSENEWYKAAYYSPLLNSGSGGYYTYATQSNVAPSNSLALVPNDANYHTEDGWTDLTNNLTPVGYFSTSPSYYGTFDQSGDVFNWNEAIVDVGDFVCRDLLGGSWQNGLSDLDSSYSRAASATVEDSLYGFRVASVPEPGSLTLLLAAAMAFGIWQRRRRD